MFGMQITQSVAIESFFFFWQNQAIGIKLKASTLQINKEVRHHMTNFN